MPETEEVLPLPEGGWTDTLTREIRRIRRCPAIERATVSASTDKVGRVFVEFAVRTDQLSEPTPTPILGVEPIRLVYRSINHVGLDSPAVWSGRDDFPRDIGHINPTPADRPASLCLARAGLQPVYDRYGIDGVLERLINWLHDAKTGQLMLDHWEPVPMGDEQDFRGGFYDIAFFQELALSHNPRGGSRFGVARLLTEQMGGRVVFLSPEFDLTDATQLHVAREQVEGSPRNEPGVAAYIPWVFVWSDSDHPIDRQLFGVWNTYGEIEIGLADTNIADKLPAAVMEALLQLTDQEAPGGKPLGLLVGVWRPKPISDNIFGVAEDTTARCLEIRAYLLHCEQHRQDPINAAVQARQLFGIQLPSRPMLEFTSGISTPESVALVGCGALGSCIGDFLIRSGIPKITFFDADDVAPHNLARHTATVSDLHARKVDHLHSLATNVTFFPNEIICRSVHQDITALSDDTFSDLATSHSTIIDATASERVRRKLAHVPLPRSTRIIRAEIFNNGQLGALFVTGVENNPNLVDLYYALCAEALNNNDIEHWLRGEQTEGPSADELLLGMGCASATTRMPKYLVAQHAAAFMPTVVGAKDGNMEPGVGINPTRSDGTPTGWQWFSYSTPAVTLEPSDLPSWQVRLAPDASAKLGELRKKYGTIETGGYLYGGYDYVLKQIYVVAVSDIPPGTSQSSTAIDLGPAGRTRLERNIARRTGGKLSRVGTWHSHPQSGPELSRKDSSTMGRFRKEDAMNGLPTLLVISWKEGDRAHLWV